MPSPGYRLCVFFVSLAAFIVPGWRRDSWRREWQAELWHGFADANTRFGSHSQAELMRRSLGSIRHAVWLRARDWRFDVLAQDLRYAVRTLRKTPAFTILAIATIALGIGANTAVFTLVNGLLLQPYPYREPERLVRVRAVDLESGRRGNMSYPDVEDLAAGARMLENIALADREPYNLGGGGETVYVQGGQVSASLFDVLGTQPLLGRTFLAGEDGPDAPRLVVLGERLWRSQFASDDDVIGREVTIDAEPYRVIGVVPAGGGYPGEARLWVTVRFDPAAQRRGSRWANVIARVNSDATIAQAVAEVESVASALAQEHPDTNSGMGMRLVGLREERTSDTRVASLLLLGVVGALLIVVCANLAGLMLMRGARRERELGVRAALGATRLRLVRQLFVESALLGVVGTALGFAFAVWAVALAVARSPVAVPDWVNLQVDGRVAGFTVGAALLATILSGLVPALRIARSDPNQAMKESAAQGNGGPSRQRGRALLIVGQIAVSIILLVAAGLMIRSFRGLSSIETGYDTTNTFMMTTAYADANYAAGEQRLDFYRDARERLLALPGVEAVGGIAQPPLRGGWSLTEFEVDGLELAPDDPLPMAFLHVVTAGYVDAAGVSVVRGRALVEGDGAEEAAEAAVVNRMFADEYWPGEDPLGKRFKFTFMEADEWISVVGVVENTKQRALVDEPTAEIYYPYERWASFYSRMTWVVRTAAAPGPTIAVAQAEVRALDNDQALYDVMTLRDAVNESLMGERLTAFLLVAFGAVALLLTSIGLYGFVAYSTAQRTHEIGIRMAVGADAAKVLRTVLTSAVTLAAIGGAIGLAGAFAMSRAMTGLLFEVSPSDPAVYVAVAVLMAAVAVVAGFVPALRATRVDPLTALRDE